MLNTVTDTYGKFEVNHLNRSHGKQRTLYLTVNTITVDCGWTGNTNSNWKYNLQNVDHFVTSSMCCPMNLYLNFTNLLRCIPVTVALSTSGMFSYNLRAVGKINDHSDWNCEAVFNFAKYYCLHCQLPSHVGIHISGVRTQPPSCCHAIFPVLQWAAMI